MTRTERTSDLYRGRTLVQTFMPDFICYGKIIVEIKAVSPLADEHRAQLLNYLSVTSCALGLLVNFGHYPKMEYERFITRKQEPVDALKFSRLFACLVGPKLLWP